MYLTQEIPFSEEHYFSACKPYKKKTRNLLQQNLVSKEEFIQK